MTLRADHECDESKVTAKELQSAPHASLLGLEDILPFLVSPDSGRPLSIAENGVDLSDGTSIYSRRGKTQLVLPARLEKHFTDRLNVPLSDYSDDAFMQYFLLSTIKQSGEINASATNVHYERHLHRLKALVADAKGLILDVGCDDPLVGASLFSRSVRYVGLDPFCSHDTPFRLIGVGECLPFGDASVDGVLFNTSLDHILDWHHAIDEAGRVLRPSGLIYLSTLAWTDRANLLSDSVHFHHFREFEIFGALDGFTIEYEKRYDYKGDPHRHGLYISARKSGSQASSAR